MATSSLTLSVDSTQVNRVLNALCVYAGLPVSLANAAALAAVPPIVPPVITVVSP